jgi:RNA polymerase sigma factor (sigma-70 family)
VGSRLSAICRTITAAATDPAGDADLLARFAATRDEAAFALVVRRHGPMVWSVCRNLLANATDADDAFQATFLALVRGAGSVRRPEALGAWLHGVAVRVASKLKRGAARRTLREKKAAAGEADAPVADSRWDEALAAVHEEVARLPDGERVAFVVCCLEGVRQPDAAAQLGWKPGTLTGRLSKAKQRLLDRLTARGLAPAAAVAAVGLGTSTGSAVVPVQLFDSVMSFAANAGTVPAALVQLSQGVADMTLTKVKLLAAAVLVAGGLITGIGASLFSNADAQSAAPGAPPPAPRTPRPAAVDPAAVTGAPAAPAAIAPATAGQSGSYGGGVARGPISQPWEYKFVDLSNTRLDNCKQTIIDEGKDGWELVTIGQGIGVGQNFAHHLAIFKRPKAAAVTSTGPGGPGMGGPGGVGGIAPATTPGGPGGYGSGGFNPTTIPGSSGGPAPAAGQNSLTPAGGGGAAPFPVATGGSRNTTSSLPALTGTGASKDSAPKVNAYTLHTIKPEYSSAANVAKVLKELIAIDEFSGEVTAVIADEGSGSLLVKATAKGKNAVEERVKQLDEAAHEKALVERKRLERAVKP